MSTDRAQEQQRMVGGSGKSPTKIMRFADRNFEDKKINPKMIDLKPDFNVILYHPFLDERVLNVWMFQNCSIPQLNLQRYAIHAYVHTYIHTYITTLIFYRSLQNVLISIQFILTLNLVQLKTILTALRELCYLRCQYLV